jgi:hypothetical protein
VLAARIAALAKYPAGDNPGPEPAAVALLDAQPVAPAGASPTMQTAVGSRPMPWEDAGPANDQVSWDDEVRRNFQIIRGWTVGSLPELVPSVAVVGGRLGTRFVSDEAAAERGRTLLAAALGLAMLRVGWSAEPSAEGRSVLRKGGTVLDPRSEIDQLASGATDAAGWRAKTTSLAIGGLRLDALRQAA